MKIIKTYKELTESLNKEDRVEISVDDKVQWCIDNLYSWYSYKILDSDELSEITSDHGTMHIKGSSLQHFPVKFANIDGSFKVASCENIDLVGGPEAVGGEYTISRCNNLESLEGMAGTVGDSVFILYCDNLKSLKGMTKTIGKYLVIHNCKKLESLDGICENIGEELVINSCINLKSLDGLSLAFPEERIRFIGYTEERANELIYNWKNQITPDELENFKSDWEI